MQPKLKNGNVSANCPDCRQQTAFAYRDGPKEFGAVSGPPPGLTNKMTSYVLMQCARCGRGGMAEIYHDQHSITKGADLLDFHPRSFVTLDLPAGVPQGVEAEFREAEVCASVKAHRAAIALLRSTLDKVLQANGYGNGMLGKKIAEAIADGIIAASREDVFKDLKNLGNEILHDPWKEVPGKDVTEALRYTQRIIEDFYDSRSAIEKKLKACGRIP